MGINDLLTHKREEIIRVAAKHGASNLRVFGSVARGEAGPESDVDLLIDLEPDRSLLDLIGLMRELEEVLGRRVDAVTAKSLHWYIKDQVIQEAVPL